MLKIPAKTNAKTEMEVLIGLASQIVRRGYGESVIFLALRRKGASQEVARLVAASVASCHAAILATPGVARHEKDQALAAGNPDLRAARAASLALSKIVNFFVYPGGSRRWCFSRLEHRIQPGPRGRFRMGIAGHRAAHGKMTPGASRA